MDDRGVLVLGTLGIEDRLQKLVLDVDQLQRFFGDRFGLRGHHRHPVAHEAHLVVERKGVQRPRNRIRLAGGRVHDPRQVLPREHRCDPVQLAGFRGVDALDAGVGVRTVQQLGDQHAAPLDIGRESRLALRQLNRIDLYLGLSDRAPTLRIRGDFDPGHDLRLGGAGRAPGGFTGRRLLTFSGRVKELRRRRNRILDRRNFLPTHHRGRP